MDVKKTLFGVQSVRETQNIDLVITLEDWNKEKEYDRLGLEEEYTEFLERRRYAISSRFVRDEILQLL